MAETDNLKLALPGSNEYVDVEVLNENFRKIDTSVLLALAAAAPYSAAATYAVGAYCTKGGKLYRCTVVIPQAEAWNAAHWAETTMGAELVAIYTTLANKAPATHAAQHAKGGADPITPESIGAVAYDAPQNLSNKEKGQARGNISALNGQFLYAEHVGGQIGWYRITEPFSYYSTSGYLTVSHAWANGGASELLLGVSSTPDTHGKLQCLRSVGQINSGPYISNARLVKVDRSTLALDLYVSGTGKNDWDLQLCNCGHNPITLTTPTFISADDTLPSGETLVAVMEYQNPPMKLGVEYKTMERYLGKPVYTMAFSFGALPNTSDKGVAMPGTDGTCKIIEIHGYASNEMSLPGVSGVSEAL